MNNIATTDDRHEFVRGIVEQHGPDLRRLAHQISGSEADAMDLVQETLLRVLKLGSSRLLDDPRAWLFRILRNAHADRCRRERKRAGVRADDVLFAIADPHTLEPCEEIMFAETIATGLEHVRCAIWCLRPLYQDILGAWLDTFHLQGACQRTALAEIFGLAPAQVASLVQRAIEALRERLGGRPDCERRRPENDPWICLSQATDTVTIRELQRELDGAENRLSVTRNCIDHLLPEEWHVRLENRWLDTMQLRGKVNRPTLWHQQQLSRGNSNYTIRVLSPLSSMRYAVLNQPGWLGEFTDRMRIHRRATAIGFLEDRRWGRIDSDVARLVGDRCWMKISIRDGSLACVFTYPRVYFTRDRATIRALIAAVTEQDEETNLGGFPWGRNTAAMLDHSYHRALGQIDELRHAADRRE